MRREAIAITQEESALLEKYYREEYVGMLSFATYTLENIPMAEVAVQETFLIASENIKKLQTSPKPVGWLYNVLKNTINRIRTDKYRLMKKVVPLSDDIKQSGTDAYDLFFDFKDEASKSEFRLLLQFYIFGYSIKELAKEYGISDGACKMRLKRAREHIKRLFEGQMHK